MRKFIDKLRNFNRRDFKDKVIFILSFLLLGVVRLTLIIVPFKFINRIMGNKKGAGSITVNKLDDIIYLSRISWAIEKAALYTPWKSKCLVKAVVAQIFLKYKKIGSTLCLGINREDSKMEAHAWAKVGNLTITGEIESSFFTEIARFSN